MIKIARSLGLTFLLAAGAALSQHAAAHGGPKDAKVTPLLTQEMKDIPGKEVLMITVDYPPGAADPVHRHDAHSYVYVLEGSIVMGVKGGQPVTLGVGQTFHEGPDDVHTIGRNASDSKPAKFVVFLLKDVGQPALVPAE